LNSLSLLIAFGALSLSGVAPFGGFFSKDAVIAEAVGSSDFGGVLSLLLIVAGLLSGDISEDLGSHIWLGEAER